MKLSRVVFAVAACSALLLASCSTTQTRIGQHPEIFNSLSPSDQALVSRGEIRPRMSQNAVWLAWGAPEEKIPSNMRGRPAETWIYMNYAVAYPYGGFGYPYGGFGYPYGFGFGFGHGAGFHTYHGHHFAYFGDPFYDPFFYSAIPPRVAYPYRTVTFVNGRVASFQWLIPPNRY